MLILADSDTCLVNAVVFPIGLVHDVVNGLFSHASEQFLEKTRHAEFPLHQITDKHHQVLAKALEHEKIGLDVVDVSNVFLDGIVDFLEEAVRKTVNINQNLLAT